MKRKLLTGAVVASGIVLLTAAPASAQEIGDLTDKALGDKQILDNLWIFIAGTLVFFMQAGFALVEAGLTRAKNVANIMMKNLMDMSAGVLAFAVLGFGIAFGGAESLGGWFGFDLGIAGVDSSSFDGSFTVDEGFGGGSLWPSTFFFFQAAFAATAATIVSGAMAERTKFASYFVYSIVITAVIYPIVLRWTWGGGWLAQLEYPFSDFAGSTIVHATGGWAAMMGAIILGPRIGKYDKDGKPRAIPGHSMPFVVLGAIILFIGWMGFNPGSELAADEFVMQIGVKTLLAAAAGAVMAMVVNWTLDKRPDVSMAANGLLAGLVAITAPVGAVETWAAVLIGGVGGVIVVFAVRFFDRRGVDDPVGAISVHAVCGTWGTLSIAFFATFDDAFLGRPDAGLFYGGGLNQLGTQVLFVTVHFVFVTVTTGLLFLAIKHTIGLRVSPEEELAGLDVEEHGAPGYGPDMLAGGTGGIRSSVGSSSTPTPTNA